MGGEIPTRTVTRPMVHADTNTLFELLRNGDRGALARAITLIESTQLKDRNGAAELISLAMPLSGKGIRIGITGIPGVGKSTLINSLGAQAIAAGHRVAVLATDPSSTRSGGSILGDKTRMEDLSRSEQAFIRPTPSSGHLGGMARMARETIVLCEAAGYDMILLETVGVGQSELEVDQMTDLNLLLMIPGAGDELQGIKRGIMESADVIVLTKTSDSKKEQLNAAQSALANAIPFLPMRESGRQPKVLLTDALAGNGITELMDHVLELHSTDRNNGHLTKRRQDQNVHWMQHAFREGLLEFVQQDPEFAKAEMDLRARVRDGAIGPFQAANVLLEKIRKGDVPLP